MLTESTQGSARDMNRDRGAILVMVMILTLLVAGFSWAILGISSSYHRVSREMLYMEQSCRASETGGAYYLSKLAADKNYFLSNPAPHDSITLGGASFRLQSAEPVEGSTSQWHIVLFGTYDDATYPLNVILGHRRIQIPDGIVATGTGSSSSTVLRLTRTEVGSFDPQDAAYDPLNPGEDANIAGRGSSTLASATVNGDVTVTGSSNESDGGDDDDDDGGGDDSFISGELTENAPNFMVEDIDPIVYDAMNDSMTTNDNAALAAVFGGQWSPVSGSQNYGDLIVNTNATYVIPAGTYRFRRFEVQNGASVVFDTSTGPSRLVYVGSGDGTGTLNDLIVNGGSSVKVGSGVTQNGLLVVLGPDCDFAISSNAIFGQSTVDPDNAGYTQIISLGGNTSSDTIQATSGAKVYARLYAAAHALTVDLASWYGSALARTVTLEDATFAVDVGTLGRGLLDSSSYQILARWPAGG